MSSSTEPRIGRAPGAGLADLLGDLLVAVGGHHGESVDDVLAGLEEVCIRACIPFDVSTVRSVALQQQLEASNRVTRESKLQQMLSTSQHLLASRRTDELLTVLVTAAREISGADVAFLNLCDDAGYMILRATAGAVSGPFRELRLGQGAGINGHVVATRSAYITPDFLADTHFSHNDEVDAAVRDEGLRTMVALPVMHRQQVVGVLSVAWRSKVTSVDDHVSTVAPLADLAAIALLNARLHDDRETAYDRLHQAHALLEQNLAIAERSAVANDRLASLLVDGADLAALTLTLSELFGADVGITDETGTVLASSPDGSAARVPDHTLAAARVNAAALSAESAAMERIWISPVLASDQLLGSVFVHRSDLEEIEQRTLDRASVLTALVLNNQRAVDEAEARAASDVVENLVGDPDRATSVARQARNLGLDTSGPIVIVVATSSTVSAPTLRSVMRGFAIARNGLAGEVRGVATAIVPHDDADAVAAELHEHAHRVIRRTPTVGAAGPARSPAGYGQAHREALKCTAALERIGREGGVGTMRTLGFVGTLLGADSSAGVPEFVRRTLGPVLNYDAAHSTDLIATVRSYFGHGRSLAATAQELSVHPNTVSQRLARIGSVLDKDWQEPDRALDIQLALKLHRLDGLDLLTN